MRLRRLALAVTLTAAALGVTAATAAPAGASPPAPGGIVCHPIEGDDTWWACEVSQWLNGPFAPPPSLRAPAWMVCRWHETPGTWPWNVERSWACGWSQVSGPSLVWNL